MNDELSATTPFDNAAVAKAIGKLNARYTRAHVEGDVATIDAMFARDATCLPPSADVLIGRAAIHDLTVAYVEGGVTQFRMDTLRCTGNGELVVE